MPHVARGDHHPTSSHGHQVLSIPSGSQNGQYNGLGAFRSTSSYSLFPTYPNLSTTVSASTQLTGGTDPSAGTAISVANVDFESIVAGRLTGLVGDTLLSYGFLVSGPAGSTLVPVDITANGSAVTSSYIVGTSSTGFGSVASLDIDSANGSLTSQLACAGDTAGLSSCPGTGASSGAFSLNQVFYVQSNVLYTVDMRALTQLLQAPAPNVAGLGSASGSAFVDPTISLAPGAGSQYTLLFSPGLNPVPEPNYLVLLIPMTAVTVLRISRQGRNTAATRVLRS